MRYVVKKMSFSTLIFCFKVPSKCRKCRFRDPHFKNFPVEHAPGPPKMCHYKLPFLTEIPRSAPEYSSQTSVELVPPRFYPAPLWQKNLATPLLMSSTSVYSLLQRKISSQLGVLRRARNNLTVDAAKRVYKSMILPKLDYWTIFLIQSITNYRTSANTSGKSGPKRFQSFRYWSKKSAGMEITFFSQHDTSHYFCF